MATRTVTAAGGVVWRLHDGAVQVALIHRPRYDDWSLPKGKLVDGETVLAAAVREVSEELGAQTAVSRRIGRVRYQLDGARKQVTYWAMRHVGGRFSANDEADAMEWLGVGKARKRLSYDIDRRVLGDFAATPAADSVIVLVRHAKAGRRSEWRGDDDLRPLDAAGRAQAERLADFLRCFAPTRLYSADRTRCVQTLEPAAAALDLPITIEPAFADEAYSAAPGATQTSLLALAKPGKVSVVCSQGITIPALIERLAPGVASSDTRKGAAWVLSMVDGDVVAADYYDDAGR